MASRKTAIGTVLVLGLGALTAGVLSTAREGSGILKGDLIFDTVSNAKPAIVVNTTDVMEFGTSAIRTVVPIRSSGGLIPISGSLSLSEVHGAASGALSIQNPIAKRLLCDQMILDVTTAANPTTIVDVGTATGAVAIGTSSGTNLFNNLSLAAGTYTATGSALVRYLSGSYITNAFALDAAGGTNDYIQIKSLTGTGQSLVGTYHLRCYYPN